MERLPRPNARFVLALLLVCLCLAHSLAEVCAKQDWYVYVAGKEELIFVEPYHEEGKIGFRDAAGDPVLLPQFDQVGKFREGLVRVRAGGKWGFVDKRGQFVVRLRFTGAADFHEGMAAVQLEVGAGKDGKPIRKWGYADRTGAQRIKPQFGSAGAFCNGMAPVAIPAWKRHGQHAYGYVDKDGKLLIPHNYREAGEFHEGLARVKLAVHWGRRDDKGNETIVRTAPHGQDGIECPEGLEAILPGGYGYINRQGMLVIENQFRDAKDFSDGLARVKIDGKWAYIDKGGKPVIKTDLDYATALGDFSCGLAAMKKDDKWGFIDKSGAFVIEPTYEDVGGFHEDLARVKVRTPKLENLGKIKEFRWGYINPKGEFIIPPAFAEASDFADGIARVCEPKLGCGYIDKTGGLDAEEWHAVPNGTVIQEGLAPAYGRYEGGHPGAGIGYQFAGYMDRFGKVVVKPRFEQALGFSGGLARARWDNRRWENVQEGRAELVRPYLVDQVLREGDVWSSLGYGRVGFVDRKGEFVIQPEYDLLYAFRDGLALAALITGEDDRGPAAWLYLDEKGETALGPFLSLGKERLRFSDGLAPARHGGKWGYVNEVGRMVIEAKYALAGDFQDGLARVVVGKPPDRWSPDFMPGGKWGCIDVKGKAVVEPKYDYVAAPSDGMIRVNVGGRPQRLNDRDMGGKWGFADARGRVVAEPQFEDADDYHGGLAAVKVKGKWGYLDRDGKLKIPAIFDDAGAFWEGKAASVRICEKELIIDTNGKTVPAPEKKDGGRWALPPVDDAPDFSRDVEEPVTLHVELSSFNEGRALILVNGKWGYIDKKGDVVIKPEYDGAGNFWEGLAAVQVGEKWGYIDGAGRMAIKPQFDEAWAFSEGLASVCMGTGW